MLNRRRCPSALTTNPYRAASKQIGNEASFRDQWFYPWLYKTALRTAATMTWRGVSPLIDQRTATYERGVRLTAKLFQPINQ